MKKIAAWIIIALGILDVGIVFAKDQDERLLIEHLDGIQQLNTKEAGDWEILETEEEGIEEKIFQNKFDWLPWKSYRVPSIYKPEGNSEYVWIRKKFTFPEKLSEGGTSIRLGVLTGKDLVYFNGVFIGKTGDIESPGPDSYDKIRIYQIPDAIINAGSENVLLIKLKKYFPDETGITMDRVSIGPTVLILKEFYSESARKMLLLAIYFTVGSYFLFLFMKRRKEKENLLFALFTFSLITYLFMRTQIKYELPLDFITMKQLEYFSLSISIPLFSEFIRVYFKESLSFFKKVIDIVILLVSSFYLISSDLILFNEVNKKIIQPLWILFLFHIFMYLYSALRKKHRDSVYVAAGVTCLLISLVSDILSDRGYFSFPLTFGYVFMSFIFSLGFILANKFVRINNEVEELNNCLENKVAERTEELNCSLAEVSKLKKEQDGDYFLTSLLLNPLMTNNAGSSTVNVDFYCSQKKTFEFKNKKYEIGGDICISSNIELSRKRYTVFINGDAMGKSIQGAGGALVLGVVFNAVIARSSKMPYMNKSPEEWLTDAFNEMQRIFEGFNGSMYASCVFGLLEESSGLLYYINAEHPWIVLYRNDRAEFIEKSLSLHKLGFMDNEKRLYIKTFQMKTGDVLLIGSDGRDDIRIEENGFLKMNEDENLFLQTAEEGRGHIKNIFEMIQSKGEISDDCSLLRLEYIGKPVSIEKQNMTGLIEEIFTEGKRDGLARTDVINFLKSLGRVYPKNAVSNRILGIYYYRNRKFLQALKYLESHLEETNDSSTLKMLSRAYKKTGNYKLAVETGERVLYRRKANKGMISHMKKLYRLTGENEKQNILDNSRVFENKSAG